MPIVVTVTGEGGSGGALALGVGDRVLMLEYAIYSVISPEGCAAILWKDQDRKAEAAEAMKITAPDLLALGVVDEIIPEPPGGAHTDPAAACRRVGDVDRARRSTSCSASRPNELIAAPLRQVPGPRGLRRGITPLELAGGVGGRAGAGVAAAGLERAGVPSWLAALLARRGVDGPARRRTLPSALPRPAPRSVPARRHGGGGRPAAGRPRAREKVAIVGDYDVDGISATALLLAVFARLRHRGEGDPAAPAARGVRLPAGPRGAGAGSWGAA